MKQLLTRYKSEIADIVIQQLAGKYSQALTKYSYLEQGADYFLQLTSRPEYVGYSKEIMLLQNIAKQLAPFSQAALNVIDLGPGNGEKALTLLSFLNHSNTTYLAIDKSPHMLAIAKENQIFLNELKKFYLLNDFSNNKNWYLQLNKKRSNTTLFLLLGNTVANEIDMEGMLANLKLIIANSNANNKYLLLGIELFSNNMKQILLEYQNESNQYLSVIPLHTLGINLSVGGLAIVFNQGLQRIEEKFIFNQHGSFIVNNKLIEYQKNDELLLSVTWKPTLNTLTSMFKKIGYSINNILLKDNQALILLETY